MFVAKRDVLANDIRERSLFMAREGGWGGGGEGSKNLATYCREGGWQLFILAYFLGGGDFFKALFFANFFFNAKVTLHVL